MYVIASCPSVSLILIRTYSRCVHPESVLSYCDDPFRFFSRDTHSQREEQCRPVTQVLQAAPGSTLESILTVMDSSGFSAEMLSLRERNRVDRSPRCSEAPGSTR